jgi:hypothetical protein
VTQRLLAIVTETVGGGESIDAIVGRGRRDDVELRLVLPAAEEAEERLEASLEELRRRGVSASGVVGDADPVLAAQDALREAPADEVVIFERAPDQARWFENGLFERAGQALSAPLRMVVVHAGDCGGSHIIAA